MTTAISTKLCAISDVAPGQALRTHAAGHDPIAVCNVAGKLHAIADTCTHGMASLSEGDIEGSLIFCPFHGGSFDIETGAAVDRPCTIALRTYAVVERDGDLFLASEGI
jgi:nitrite reductase/ring-hydroxylating ferredoxin subunit